jgi:hypothetical protein
MKDQNYSNHKQYYIPHHFVFYPTVLALMAFGIYKSSVDEALSSVWMFLTVLVAVVAWLSFMVRQHYGMTVQDRIIFMELRYRYFVMTGERFEAIEAQLSKGQLFALRFASDAEFVPLIKRAIDEQLSGTAIKQSIKQWKADNQRV